MNYISSAGVSPDNTLRTEVTCSVNSATQEALYSLKYGGGRMPCESGSSQWLPRACWGKPVAPPARTLKIIIFYKHITWCIIITQIISLIKNVSSCNYIMAI